MIGEREYKVLIRETAADLTWPLIKYLTPSSFFPRKQWAAVTISLPIFNPLQTNRLSSYIPTCEYSNILLADDVATEHNMLMMKRSERLFDGNTSYDGFNEGQAPQGAPAKNLLSISVFAARVPRTIRRGIIGRRRSWFRAFRRFGMISGGLPTGLLGGRSSSRF